MTSKPRLVKKLPQEEQLKYKEIASKRNSGDLDSANLMHNWKMKHEPDYAVKKLQETLERQEKIKQRTPKGQTQADKDAITEVFRESRRVSEETGDPHHVDHIFPLTPIKIYY